MHGPGIEQGCRLRDAVLILERIADVFGYIEVFSNPKSRHSTNGDLSPVEHERRYAP